MKKNDLTVDELRLNSRYILTMVVRATDPRVSKSRCVEGHCERFRPREASHYGLLPVHRDGPAKHQPGGVLGCPVEWNLRPSR